MKEETEQKTRDLVRSKYAEIARGNSCCCGRRTAASAYAEVGETYRVIDGYVAEADLGLGCGVPTELAGIREGDHVLDLGSGAGNDAFIARREVGKGGRVVGVDFTGEMNEQARTNAEKLGFTNVEFLLGEIEDLPLSGGAFDVVISNCVLNLVPNKIKVFSEICRVLKPGGHFCISDVVLEGRLPDKMRRAAEFYVGCVAGALQKADYLAAVAGQGFRSTQVLKEREIRIPDADLLEYLDPGELEEFRRSGTRILSITVKANRPEGLDGRICCDATS